MTDNIIDVSLPLKQGMITYPNNPPLTLKTVRGESTTHTVINMGSHTGTHIDAPKHVFDDGIGIDKISANTLIGKCRVVQITNDTSIKKSKLEKLDIKKDERILFKTNNSNRGFDTFYKDYVYIEGDSADYLAEVGVALVGIDALGVKKCGSKDQRAHTSLLKAKIVIIEGLDLSKVNAGEYFLIALPPKFVGLDGAPARVMLVNNILNY